jgi:hypothetical protein
MGDTIAAGKAQRILAAIATGAETVADVEADLQFTLTKHCISGHISNLQQGGKIEKIGEMPISRADGRAGRPAHRYRLTGSRSPGTSVAPSMNSAPSADSLPTPTRSDAGLSISSDTSASTSATSTSSRSGRTDVMAAPRREIVIDGRRFEVVWDGRCGPLPGFEDRPGSGSSLLRSTSPTTPES